MKRRPTALLSSIALLLVKKSLSPSTGVPHAPLVAIASRAPTDSGRCDEDYLGRTRLRYADPAIEQLFESKDE